MATAFLVGLAGVVLGVWWAPFFAGVAIGLVAKRQRDAVPLGAVAGLVAWLVPLAVLNVRLGLGRTAAGLAAIMGFNQAAVPVFLTLLVGALLGLTGAWLAGAARAVLQPAAR